MYVVYNEDKLGTSITTTRLSQQDLGNDDLKSQSRNCF